MENTGRNKLSDYEGEYEETERKHWRKFDVEFNKFRQYFDFHSEFLATDEKIHFFFLLQNGDNVKVGVPKEIFLASSSEEMKEWLQMLVDKYVMKTAP